MTHVLIPLPPTTPPEAHRLNPQLALFRLELGMNLLYRPPALTFVLELPGVQRHST
jgi:hypothetical protein